MADAARWITAGAPALGWNQTGEGSFAAAYVANRNDAAAAGLEADAIGAHLRTLAETGFRGTTSTLLARLETMASEAERRSRAWPPNATALGRRLSRLQPSLRRLGHQAKKQRISSRGTVWTLGDPPPEPEPCIHGVSATCNDCLMGLS
jgi:hypothetical protein